MRILCAGATDPGLGVPTWAWRQSVSRASAASSSTFAMARGTDDVQLALDMSKYFDTNYRASVNP